MKLVKAVFPYLIMCFSLYSGWMEKTAVMTVSFFMFVIVLVIMNFDKVEKLKASMTGVEIVARAEQVIREAEVTTEQLRKLMLVIADNQLETIINSGRLVGFDIPNREKRKERIMSLLDDIAVSEASKKKLLEKNWNYKTLGDMASFLYGGIKHKSGRVENDCEELEAKYEDRQEPIHPDDLDAFFMNNVIPNAELNEFLQDYRYYYENKEHRRFEKWKNNEWQKLELACKPQETES